MQIQAKEIWKDIPGTSYSVSNYGNVFSKKRKKILKQSFLSGYPSVCINQKRKLVHRVVLEFFIGKCPDGMEACHNDGNKLNNNLSNLRWDTHRNNCLDKISHGTSLSGSKNHKSKINDSTAAVISKIYCLVRMKDLKDYYKLSDVNISMIAKGYVRRVDRLQHIYDSNKLMAPIRLKQSQKRGFPGGK
jgi:hypothetical protein